MHSGQEARSAGLVEVARELVPLLKEEAGPGEEKRQLTDDTVSALRDSGILRMRMPKRYGGSEADFRTLVEVIAELARGDGSAAWTTSVWAISSWVAGLFPDDVQDEVFADPDVRVCGILSPTAVATPVDGGITVSGKWSFNTGAELSRWSTNAAVIAHPDGSYEPIMTLIPTSELLTVDDWHTTGIRASASVTSIADGVFVPAERYLSMGPVMNQQYASVRNAGSAMFHPPFLPMASATVGAVALGLARAGQEAFLERLPGRKITYTDYADQSQAPLTHLQIGEARTKVDEAGFHALRIAERIDAKAAAGESWSLDERALARLDLGATVSRAVEAIDVLSTASGGSSVYTSVPIQRIARDIHTLKLHAIMHPNTNLELFGRMACGLPPNTQYI